MIRNIFKVVYDFRHFISSSIKNDFRARVARSRVGAAWVILQPLAQSAIFAIVLSEVLSARLPGNLGKFTYAVYLLAGMLCWSLFFEIVTRSIGIFIENANLLKKISFPRITLPIIGVGSGLLNNTFLAVATVIVCLFMNVKPSAAWLSLPILMLITAALATGIGLFWGIINVFLRDVSQVAPVLLQLWFWMTPIVYTRETVPSSFAAILQINPMTPLVNAYQDVFVKNEFPDFSTLIYPTTLSILALAIAYVTFRRASPDMTDVL